MSLLDVSRSPTLGLLRRLVSFLALIKPVFRIVRGTETLDEEFIASERQLQWLRGMMLIHGIHIGALLFNALSALLWGAPWWVSLASVGVALVILWLVLSGPYFKLIAGFEPYDTD